MVLPKQTVTVLDPGIGLVEPAATSPLYTGLSSAGTSNQLYSFSDAQTVRTTLGYGHLAEDIMLALRERGGPVLAIRLGAPGAGTVSAVTQAGSGPAMSVTGNPNDDFAIRVEVKKGGALGVAEFTYTLDRHDVLAVDPTPSAQRIIPGGGSFTPTGTGLTFTFAAGTYVVGTTYDLTTVASNIASGDLAAAVTVLSAYPSLKFPLWVQSGSFTSAVTGFGVASALGGHLTTLASQFKYLRGLCDVGSGDSTSNILTNESSLSDKRISPWYGKCLVDSAAAFEGFSVRRTSCVGVGAARAGRELISTDLARFASGALGGVRKTEFNGFSDETLDGAKISTLRTWPGIPGIYIANARLKSAAGSDFVKLQYGRIMDAACTAVYEAMLPFIAEGFRTNSDGTIFEGDAVDIEARGNSALFDVLLSPNNARGTAGHVSAAKFVVDRSTNLNTTQTLKTRTAVRPLGYADFINQDVGFTLSV
jgi:hypothetical protein